jgi:hypothetical protein
VPVLIYSNDPIIIMISIRLTASLCFVEECLDLESFLELEDGELTQLGFKMGDRKKVTKWIASQKTSAGDEPLPVVSPPPSQPTSPAAVPLTPETRQQRSPSPQQSARSADDSLV